MQVERRSRAACGTSPVATRGRPAGARGLACLAWGLLSAGCLVPEPHADGVVPPGSLRPIPAGVGALDGDLPRARGAPAPTATQAAPGFRGSQVAAGSTRLSGTVSWSALPRDVVVIAAWRPGQVQPLAQQPLRAPGPFLLDVPVDTGALVVQAWIDDSGDGPDATDLASAPVELDLDAGAPPTVDLVLGASP